MKEKKNCKNKKTPHKYLYISINNFFFFFVHSKKKKKRRKYKVIMTTAEQMLVDLPEDAKSHFELLLACEQKKAIDAFMKTKQPVTTWISKRRYGKTTAAIFLAYWWNIQYPDQSVFFITHGMREKRKIQYKLPNTHVISCYNALKHWKQEFPTYRDGPKQLYILDEFACFDSSILNFIMNRIRAQDSLCFRTTTLLGYDQSQMESISSHDYPVLLLSPHPNNILYTNK